MTTLMFGEKRKQRKKIEIYCLEKEIKPNALTAQMAKHAKHATENDITKMVILVLNPFRYEMLINQMKLSNWW